MWNHSLDRLSGVTPALRTKFAKLNIETIFDLLLHIPSRYHDKTRYHSIAELADIARQQPDNQQVYLGSGTVVRHAVTYKPRPISSIFVEDDTGQLQILYFHRYNLAKSRPVGSKLFFCGTPSIDRYGLTLRHPETKKSDIRTEYDRQGYLSGYYPTTANLSQGQLATCIDKALEWLASQPVADWEEALDRLISPTSQSVDFISALTTVHHCNQAKSNLDAALQRLRLEELLAHYLHRMHYRQHRASGRPLPSNDDAIATLNVSVGFAPTVAQQRVADEVLADLAQPHAMARLVQGDVGSGKTWISAQAIVTALANNTQACLFAPTTVLAQQHFTTLSGWFQASGYQCLLLTSATSKKDKLKILTQIEQQQPLLLIGTHAVLEDDVRFANLSLVVIDEQHRFGVEQKYKFHSDLGHKPHTLSMTATPIPRTLAMTVYADLDISIVDEMPPGRKPTITTSLHSDRLMKLYERVTHAVANDAQIFWVCPLVEDSDVLDITSVEARYEHMVQALPQARIGLLHGKVHNNEKLKTLEAFRNRELDILVATTVIEVGVDIPKATIMIVENAERFGLAQIHQLRGRVGRGADQSFCLLMTPSNIGSLAKQRIELLCQEDSGHKIADADLKMRGPGQLFGIRQAGATELRAADFKRDSDLIEVAKTIGDQIPADVKESIRAGLVERWLGAKGEYGTVA